MGLLLNWYSIEIWFAIHADMHGLTMCAAVSLKLLLLFDKFHNLKSVQLFCKWVLCVLIDKDLTNDSVWYSIMIWICGMPLPVLAFKVFDVYWAWVDPVSINDDRKLPGKTN